MKQRIESISAVEKASEPPRNTQKIGGKPLTSGLILRENKLIYCKKDVDREIQIEDIIVIKYEKPYCCFYIKDQKPLMIKETVSRLKDSLPPCFIRINRSTLMNACRITYVCQKGSDYVIYDKDKNKKYIVSQRRRKEICTQVRFWKDNGMNGKDVKMKVFVSGCFDMLHSGHVAFLNEAAAYGDVYVGIGSDKTIFELKGRLPENNETERLYMIQALKCVKEACINSGSGKMDFCKELEIWKPDIFFVNEDGHSEMKERLCREKDIFYIVGKRLPFSGLPSRSTTFLRKACRIPYRIDLAGGWLDQPYVNKYFPGPVITICVEPDYEFEDRSGMAGSTRRKAIELWHTDIPQGDKEMLAMTLFCMENFPGGQYVSGSQDALGIVMPGLNRYDYDNGYWPDKITRITDRALLNWIEKYVWLLPLPSRQENYDVLKDTRIDAVNVKALSDAAHACWKALLAQDLRRWGETLVESFEAQVAMFPYMLSPEINGVIEQYKSSVLGWKLSGAGGGGYLILVSERSVAGAFQIRIRRE